MILVHLQAAAATTYPTVVAHGMGDSCFNQGMQGITEVVGNTTGGYATCIPTGNNKGSDTTNSFFMTMNNNVDKFNENIQKDPKLKNQPWINCVGFSQVFEQ